MQELCLGKMIGNAKKVDGLFIIDKEPKQSGGHLKLFNVSAL